MVTQAERRAITRGRILDAARTRFTQHGWEATSISAILDDSGVSRGALYHHFASKEDVFAAVFSEVSADAIGRAGAAVVDAGSPIDPSPLQRFISACAAWLQIVQEPHVARVLLIDGPSALGWQRCRELESATSLHVTEAGLAMAARSGEIAPPSIRAAALLVNALLADAALATLTDAAAEADLFATIVMMIEGLSPSSSG